MSDLFFRRFVRLKSSSLGRDVLLNSVLTTLGRSLGLLIPLFVAAWFGTTSQTDAFFLANGIVLFLTTLLGNILETVVVPYVADYRMRGQSVGGLIGKILMQGTAWMGGVMLVLALAVKPLLLAATPLSNETVNLSLYLFLEMIPMVIVVGWTSAVNGALNAYKIFYVGSLYPAVRSIVVLLAAWFLKPWLGIHAIALSFVLGEVLRCLLSFYHFQTKIGQIRFTGVHVPESGHFFKSAFFQSLGLAFISVTTLVDQVMASWTGQGSLSLYTYANRLFRIPFQMISTGASTVVLSHWAEQVSRDKRRLPWPEVRGTLAVFMIAMTLVFLGGVLLKDRIAALAFGYGEFPNGKILDAGHLFGILMAGLPFQMVNLFCVRLFILYHEHPFYMWAGLARVILDVILNFILMQFWGIFGIAWATTLLNIIFAGLFYMKAKKLSLAAHSE